MNKTRLFAYYLPQYHPVKENNLWWGNGFTEWSNVTKAVPLFRGHNQPRLPADLGFYDLRVPEVREHQAELARSAGIEGFVYYHYWFGDGRRLLERPFKEVLQTGKPDLPFMLCWANETWKGVWFGTSMGKLLMEQVYPGRMDYVRHFRELIPAFTDSRYCKVDGKPVFTVYRPQAIPDISEFVDVFREEAHKSGIGEIYLLAGDKHAGLPPASYEFDGVVSNRWNNAWQEANVIFPKEKAPLLHQMEQLIRTAIRNPNPHLRTTPYKVNYGKFSKQLTDWKVEEYDYFPLIVPDWDNTARIQKRSLILTNSTPELWSWQVRKALSYSDRYPADRKFVFIKSWNEWAEGNYLEPDQRWGHGYLNALQEELRGFHNRNQL